MREMHRIVLIFLVGLLALRAAAQNTSDVQNSNTTQNTSEPQISNSTDFQTNNSSQNSSEADAERQYWTSASRSDVDAVPPLDYLSKDYQGALALCSTPEFQNQQCGFAGQQEWQQTLTTQCPTCDTLNAPFPAQLPAALSGDRSTVNTSSAGNDTWPVWYTGIVSLACKGRVLVRTVFKIVEQPGIQGLPHLTGELPDTYQNCTSARLSELPDSHQRGLPVQIVRCELQLPDDAESASQSEENRAKRAKEGQCYICNWCDKLPSETVAMAGCPSNTGQWYSDSYMTVASGCNFTRVSNGMPVYEGQRVELVIRPRTKILLADAKVCDERDGCVNTEYEDGKLKDARRCINGVCK